jgi:predicted DNA-binding transcriptional regulator YafY
VTQLAAVAEAVWGQRRLRISYRRRTGVAERTIDPLGVVLKAGTWYLAARSVSGGRVDTARSVSGGPVDAAGDAEGGCDVVLTFRVDRIAAAEPTGETFRRPDGFDLADWWADATARFASRMLRATVRLRLGPRGMKMLPHVTDADAAVRALAGAGEPDAEGRREVELDVEDVVVAASQLTGLGGEVEALDPPELRTALAEAGAALAARNAPR